MQKFIGSLLIISATTGWGIMYGAGLTEELEEMLRLRHVLSLLKGELMRSKLPLEFMFERLSHTVPEPYGSWFLDMLGQIEKRKKRSFSAIWSDSIDRELSGLRLKRQYITGLKNLGRYMAGADGEESAAVLLHYLKRLDHEAEAARDAMYSKKRLGNCIGVMAGVFLVILLV